MTWAKSTGMRGQAAVEVLAYAAFFLLVFVTSVAIFLQLQEQELSRAENAFAQEVAYGFADHIETAFVAGKGFSQTVTLPSNIHGKPYIITVSKAERADLKETGFVYVDWQGPSRINSFSAPTITSSYDLLVDPSGFISNPNANSILINASKGLRVKIENTGSSIKFSKG
ncbi:TPA: hypothetical protein HA225_06605 [Candidatus Micrarchaeota archaeon]|nr:hypothetical protein [Candidatus Micrarchaeota archaeon]HIH30868.1 hypothetical protein [Candidatus Micrarchaeota archaeon]